VNKVEHIGIAVKSIEESNDLFAALLGTKPYKREVVESEGVVTAFFKTGDTKIELLESSKPESAIAKFIARRGEGLHHIAFEVENIIEEIERLKELGFTVLNESAIKGADDKIICFLHPKTTSGVLIELCQQIKPVL